MRTSPLHDCLARLSRMGRAERHADRLRFADAERITRSSWPDLSQLPAAHGLKGPRRRRAGCVSQRRRRARSGANAWTRSTDGGSIARLGRSEFLLEDGPRGDACRATCSTALAPAPGVYPVLRQDAALMLRGAAVNELLAQTCSVDFRRMPRRSRP